MEEFVRFAAGKIGVGEDTIRSALGGLLNLIKSNASSGDFQQLMAQVPGANALLETAPSPSGGGGGLLGRIGSALGGSAGGSVGAAGILEQTGMDSGQFSSLVSMFTDHAKKHADSGLVDRVIGAVPGLGTSGS